MSYLHGLQEVIFRPRGAWVAMATLAFMILCCLPAVAATPAGTNMLTIRYELGDGSPVPSLATSMLSGSVDSSTPEWIRRLQQYPREWQFFQRIAEQGHVDVQAPNTLNPGKPVLLVYQFDYYTGRVDIHESLLPVPEPGTLAVLATPALGLIVTMRRRQKLRISP